jgi:serine/threonine protein kinase
MQYWQPGTSINNDKYIVEQILGSGGFGITYKVRESRTNNQFAIKTLNYQCQQLPDFEQLQQKFINETIALASCRHPNIVRVYPQMFQEKGLCCMVMEYVEGQDLADYIDRRGVFSEQEAIKLIIKVGNALSHVHQQGFLHRDIKPSNILLRSSDLSPILIDFGLAREYSPNTIRSMTSALTECYAPIEQYENRGNFGAWTDVYALAATVYTMVTKQPPIPSRYRTHAELQTPQQHNPNISDRLNKAILEGMEFEPNNRPKTIEHWLNLLSTSESIYSSNKAKVESKSQRRNISKAKSIIYTSNSPISSLPRELQLEIQKSTRYRTIQILEVNQKISKQDLKEVFSEYGTVEKVDLTKQNWWGRSDSDYALIQMKTVEEAHTAFQALDGAEWMGTIIRVSLCEDLMRYRAIEVSNLDRKISEQDLKEVFSEYGTVENINLIESLLNTTWASGVKEAVILMKTIEEANTAIQALDGAEWMGHTLNVKRPGFKS